MPDSRQGTREPSDRAADDGVYFFPDRPISADEVNRMLASGTPEERADVVAHLLRFAQWDDIWQYVSRDEVRGIFDTLELPESLRQAWGRMLKVEAPVPQAG